MAVPALSKDHWLLLLFKDDPLLRVRGGFPILPQSLTILFHRAIYDSGAEKELQAMGEEAPASARRSQGDLPFPRQAIAEPLWPPSPPKERCVWGWWRKPWEYHPTLFRQIHDWVGSGKTLNVLLYNQYVRQGYKAKLHGIYFQPFLTTVRIPGTWYQFCPHYYRDIPRQCGAFLVLEINREPLKEPDKLLERLFVDSASFEIEPDDFKMVIAPDEPIREVTSGMVDKPLGRLSLRESDHTLLLVRKYRQEGMTGKLLEKVRVDEDALASAFAETEWGDTRRVLSTATPVGWANLAHSPRALDEIGAKARREGSRITRFDIELTASALSSETLPDLFVKGSTGTRTFTDLGSALRRWATSADPASARKAAAEIFEAAWKAASNRYKLSELTGHFERLPGLEAVASAVQHEIGGKFYRDHLSHNVRAALLAARLAEANCPPGSRGQFTAYVSFFSGLFHDIALPISSFPDIVSRLAKALATLHEQENSLAFRQQGLLAADFLQRSISYVAELCSVPAVLEKYPEGFRPWEKPDSAMKPVDPRVMQELLLCAKAEDHAIISAAILFDRAVSARCKGDPANFDRGLHTLMLAMTGPNREREAQEFLAILQCIALHDRKASLRFHPVATFPRDAPVHLLWDDFTLPIVVSVADECQEWGRPVGSLEGLAIVDADIRFSEGKLEARYVWDADQKTFASVPYSLLHMLFGKLRFCFGFRRRDGAASKPLALAATLEGLKAFQMAYVAFEDFQVNFRPKVSALKMRDGPEEGLPENQLVGKKGQHLIRICVTGASQQAHDYLIVEGEPTACEEIVKAANGFQVLRSIRLDGEKLWFECEAGKKFAGRLAECYFGEVDSATPTGHFLEGEVCSVFHVEMISEAPATLVSSASPSHSRHRLPHPHFLDLDWRFTERTARWIAATAKQYANGGEICYLGCPTVALYHHSVYPSDADWLLLDRGHFALSQWIREGLIPEELHKTYDVFDALPPELMRRFAAVVTDPPWYKSEYARFCSRVAELAKPGGLVLVSSYPPYPPYKRGKHLLFEQLLASQLSDPTWLGSMEIDYEVPEFELVWGGHKPYFHSGLRVYRPAYLEVYRATSVATEEGTDGGRPRSLEYGGESRPYLPESKGIGDDHHIRYTRDLEAQFPCAVAVERYKDLHRIEPLGDIVAWTTRNTVVRLDPEGTSVPNMEALLELVQTRDKDRKLQAYRTGAV